MYDVIVRIKSQEFERLDYGCQLHISLIYRPSFRMLTLLNIISDSYFIHLSLLQQGVCEMLDITELFLLTIYRNNGY